MEEKLAWWGVDDLRTLSNSSRGDEEAEGRNGSKRRREEEEQAIRERMARSFQSRGVASTSEDGGNILTFLDKYFEIQVRVSQLLGIKNFKYWTRCKAQNATK